MYLLFKDFDIETSTSSNLDQCKNDFLVIEASTGQKFVQVIKYCNSNKPTLAPSPLLINSGTVKIRFKSDNAITGRGFLLEATSYDPTKGKPTQKTITVSKDAASEKPKEVLSNVKPKKTKYDVPVTPYVLTSGTDVSPELENMSGNDTKPMGNNTVLETTQRRKKKNKETDWTIFTIAAFSCFVVILIIFVTVISVRKCMSGQRGNAKFLPAVSGKELEIQRRNVESVHEISRSKEAAASRHDEQFSQMKSPAGSIAHAGDEEEEGGASEKEPLTRAIVNHDTKTNRERQKSIIDMYSDGADVEVHGQASCSPEMKDTTLQLSQTETVI